MLIHTMIKFEQLLYISYLKLLTTIIYACILNTVKESGSMVNITSKIIAKTPTWGGFNHTIILKNGENTKFLDFL